MPIRENDTTFVFNIKSFQSGINEQLAEGLLKMYEAVKCNNCDISNGSLSTFPEPTEWYKENEKIGNVLPFYNFTSSDLFLISCSTMTSLYFVFTERVKKCGTKIPHFISLLIT